MFTFINGNYEEAYMEECVCSEENVIDQFNALLKVISQYNYPYYQEVSRCLKDIKIYNEELYEHSRNVAFFSLLLGSHFYKSNKEINELYIASLLHDYGKLFIPKNILEKPDILSKKERQKIEIHSIAGYVYLKQHTKLPTNILYGVLDHHERVDGCGYLLCKKEYKISNYAKIIAIADVYDSMISDRVYRKCIPKEKVEEYIRSNAGTHFNYDLSILFLDLLRIIPVSDLVSMKQQLKNEFKIL